MTTVVTTKMVAEIRRRRAAGEPLRDVAAALGLSKTTVQKYTSEKTERNTLFAARQAAKKLKNDAERWARKKAKAAEYQSRVREQRRAAAGPTVAPNKKVPTAVIRMIRKQYKDGLSIAKIALFHGISQTSVKKYSTAEHQSKVERRERTRVWTPAKIELRRARARAYEYKKAEIKRQHAAKSD